MLMAWTTDDEGALFSSKQLFEKAAFLSLPDPGACRQMGPRAGLRKTVLDLMFRKTLCNLSKCSSVLVIYYLLFYHTFILGLALLLCFIYLICFLNKGLEELVYMK